MSLYVVATPIGNSDDLSPRARQILASADLILGEEHRVTSTLLKALGIPNKEIDLLNEHSTEKDIKELVKKCRDQRVALISDCGTPGFCDPGAELVGLCRAQKIAIHSIPGPSSLMAFLSVCGVRLDQFQFLGFLPAKGELRTPALKKLSRENQSTILMDTPYRLGRLLEELAGIFPKRKATIGMNLSKTEERIESGTLRELSDLLKNEKAEFLILLHSGGDDSTLARKTSR